MYRNREAPDAPIEAMVLTEATRSENFLVRRAAADVRMNPRSRFISIALVCTLSLIRRPSQGDGESFVSCRVQQRPRRTDEYLQLVAHP